MCEEAIRTSDDVQTVVHKRYVVSASKYIQEFRSYDTIEEATSYAAYLIANEGFGQVSVRDGQNEESNPW